MKNICFIVKFVVLFVEGLCVRVQKEKGCRWCHVTGDGHLTNAKDFFRSCGKTNRELDRLHRVPDVLACSTDL